MRPSLKKYVLTCISGLITSLLKSWELGQHFKNSKKKTFYLLKSWEPPRSHCREERTEKRIETREEKENRTEGKNTQKKKKNRQPGQQLPIAQPPCLEEETPAAPPSTTTPPSGRDRRSKNRDRKRKPHGNKEKTRTIVWNHRQLRQWRHHCQVSFFSFVVPDSSTVLHEQWRAVTLFTVQPSQKNSKNIFKKINDFLVYFSIHFD